MAHKGVDISWRDFSAVRPLSRSEKKARKAAGDSMEPVPIINQINGVMKSGTYTTILGPSGSGKTTFLNFLSNRLHYLNGLDCTGDVFINGIPRKDIDYNSVAGYVMQEEVLLEHLKVRETLEFIASFKLPKDKKADRVDEVISQLGLKNCEYNFIGGFMKKGISGGEKKRVAIAVEMLADPSVLFLDEPTTGLDSYNAESLTELLNGLARTGVTVIATIHQPNSYIFALFDRILLLGGTEVIYHGKAKKSLRHFKKIGFECPEFSNPAEFLLGLLTPSDDKFDEKIALFKQASSKTIPALEVKELPSLFHREPIGFFRETFLLINRSMINTTRNKLSILYKAIANFCFLLLTLAAYFDACNSTTPTSVSDRAGIIFLLIVYMAFISVNSATSLSTDKAIFIREQASKTYSPAAFYMSKLLFDIPFDQILVLIMGFLLYLSVGLSLHHAYQIFFFVFALLILDLNTRGWGNLLLIALPNLEASSAATPFVLILQLLFAGLFINYDSIPNYLIWLEYISMFKFTWSAIMINEFESWWEESVCNAQDSTGFNSLCDPLNYYSITIGKWENILALSIITIGVHFFAYLSLSLVAKRFRIN
jgi:ABC-type multidrug transport system ATPase subunit/ABC-type multidrug transport system permease subunit